MKKYTFLLYHNNGLEKEKTVKAKSFELARIMVGRIKGIKDFKFLREE